MILNYYINNYLCNTHNINNNFYWLVIDNFYKSINNDKYQFILFVFLDYIY